MMNTIIRLAQECDLDNCMSCLQNSAIATRYYTDKDHTKKIISNGITKQELFIIVFEEKTIAGLYWASPNGMFSNFPYLRILSVHVDFRNKGLGKILLHHFEVHGFKAASKVFLAVSDFNVGAQHFYLKNGYEKVGEVPALFKPDITEFIMVKRSNIAKKE